MRRRLLRGGTALGAVAGGDFSLRSFVVSGQVLSCCTTCLPPVQVHQQNQKNVGHARRHDTGTTAGGNNRTKQRAARHTQQRKRKHGNNNSKQKQKAETETKPQSTITRTATLNGSALRVAHVCWTPHNLNHHDLTARARCDHLDPVPLRKRRADVVRTEQRVDQPVSSASRRKNS